MFRSMMVLLPIPVVVFGLISQFPLQDPFAWKWLFIDNTDTDSDGLTFVMQSSGLNALANQAGPTIGVWADIGGTDPLSSGAIPQSFAIEFDTYHNNVTTALGGSMLDRDVPSGHHIAWNFPGSNDAYTTDGWLIIDKVLNHRDTVSVPDISDGQWHILQ